MVDGEKKQARKVLQLFKKSEIEQKQKLLQDKQTEGKVEITQTSAKLTHKNGESITIQLFTDDD